MDRFAFNGLVDEVNHWWISDVPDWVRLTDSDRLRDLPNATAKRKWLRKAKIECQRRSIQDRVDEISEALESEDEILIAVLLEAFAEDIKNYKLPDSLNRIWINKAQLAARGRGVNKATDETVVYFITIDNVHVKIGFTTNLTHRLRSLRTADFREPKVLFVTSGSRVIEQKLHKMFADRHVGREWFILAGEIEFYIAHQKHIQKNIL